MRIKIILSALAVGFALVLSFFYFSSGVISNSAGEITVEIIDEDGHIVTEKTIDFKAGDTLYDVLDRHFNLKVSGSEHDTFGRILLGIDEIDTDFQTRFIHIEIDGEGARKGIDHLPLQDGSTYRFSVRQPY